MCKLHVQLISTLERMMTVDTPYYDFSNLDETEECYSNVVVSIRRIGNRNRRIGPKDIIALY